MQHRQDVYRGDIFYCDFGQDNLIGSEQRGMRPVVVIQNDMGNKFSPTVIVASVTTKPKKALPTHVNITGYNHLTEHCTVLLEQQRTVDKNRLHEYLDTVTPKDMKRINKAILVSLGLPTK